MNITAWTNKKQELAEKHGGELRHIVSGIKRGLSQSRLTAIQSAAYNLYSHPNKAPVIIAYLNNLVGNASLKFHWFPGRHQGDGKLLIRNESIGLLVKTAPGSKVQAMIISQSENTPFADLDPEKALAALSLQVRHHFAPTNVCKLGRENRLHLAVLSSTKTQSQSEIN